tara:strand:+ start:1347 stop:1577 length:231 start_codon:yes stop_codon:yes gene_type:complete
MLTDLQYQKLEQAIAYAIRDVLDSPERRRFDAAKAAMTGILAANDAAYSVDYYKNLGADAVRSADALLEALEKNDE